MMSPVDPPFAEGGCHCGEVRYSLQAPPQFTFLCHCDSCRKLSSGMRLSGLSVPLSALGVQGELRSYSYPGGKGEITHYFCSRCGTSVYATPRAYGELAVVRAGTLDDPQLFTPQKSIFTAGACSWETLIAK